MLDEQQSKNKIVVVNQRDQRVVVPADSWKWGRWGLKEYKWKGVLPWLVPRARRAGTKNFYPALAALVGLVQNNFSSLYTI